jgi:thiamine-monophosphate kinase
LSVWGEDVKLRDLGERKAIDSIRKILQGGGADVGKRQDDCAVMDFGEEYLLLTTDMISRATHIPDAATPWQIGWHAAAVNLSDIAAMGGMPIGLAVSLGIPRDCNEEMLLAIMEGIEVCAQTFGTSIVGGDTKEAGDITIAGCAVGKVPKSEVLFRRGAKPGDLIGVTGELGRAASAYHVLQSNPGDESAVKNLLEILPRIREGIALGKTHAVTSCMDISDGLSSSIHQLSQLNGTGYAVDFSKLPVANEVREISRSLNLCLEEPVLYFGGDYELLFTVKEGEWDNVNDSLKDTGTSATWVGEVTEEKKNILIKDGVLKELENRGFEHFR